jgi:hypothetical protein
MQDRKSPESFPRSAQGWFYGGPKRSVAMPRECVLLVFGDGGKDVIIDIQGVGVL